MITVLHVTLLEQALSNGNHIFVNKYKKFDYFVKFTPPTGINEPIIPSGWVMIMMTTTIVVESINNGTGRIMMKTHSR